MHLDNNNFMIKVKARLNNLRTSPRKVNLVAMRLRGKSVEEALNILEFDLRKSSTSFSKLILSAKANAVNNFKLNEKRLIIDEILVSAGPTLKRWRPRAYGRASKIMKRTSKIIVVLREDEIIKESEDVTTEKKQENKTNNSKKSFEKDDLTKIEGIGPKISETLIKAGIKTFKDLSEQKTSKIDEIISDIRGNHDSTTWPEQARMAYKEEWNKLKKWQDELAGGKKK